MELSYAVRRPDCIAHRAAISQCICGALAFDRFASHKLFTTSIICIRHSPFSLPLWPSVRPCVLDLTSMCHLDPGLDHFLSPSTFLGPRPTVCIFSTYDLPCRVRSIMFTAAHRPHPIVFSCSQIRNFTATVASILCIPEAKFRGYYMYEHF